jgi:hypothetical protein
MATKKNNPAVAKRISDRKAFVKDKVSSKGINAKQARQRFYVQTRLSELKAAGKPVGPEVRKALQKKFQSGNVSRKGFAPPKRKSGSKKTPALIPTGPDQKGTGGTRSRRDFGKKPVAPVKPGRQPDGSGVLIPAEQMAKQRAAARNPKIGRQSDGRGVLMSAEEMAKQRAAKKKRVPGTSSKVPRSAAKPTGARDRNRRTY